MALKQTRRGFLGGIAAAGGASLIRTRWAQAAEGPLETTTVRIQMPGLCVIPSLYVAEEQLRAEGFTDVRYVEAPPGTTEPLASGKADFDMNYASNFVTALDAGEPITLLSGVMVGCFELFANEGIRTITDLKGRSVGVQALGSGSNSHALVTLMAAQVGLDQTRTSAGSQTRRSSRKSCSNRARLTRFWLFRRSPRSCAPAASVRCSSTPRWTGHGRNTSAACSQAPPITSARIPTRPDRCCAQF